MADTFKESLRRVVVGPETSPMTHNPSLAQSGLGMALWGVGLIGSLKAAGKMKSYEDVTAGSRGMVASLTEDFNKDAAAISAGLTTGLDANFANVKGQIASSMSARGLTDPGQQAGSQAQYGASLSGAYAAAADALAKAKVNATNTLAATKSTYFQNMAAKQFESTVNQARVKAGIYGALTGAAAAGVASIPDMLRKGAPRSNTPGDNASHEQEEETPLPQTNDTQYGAPTGPQDESKV